MRLISIVAGLALGLAAPVAAQERGAPPPELDARIRELAAAFSAQDAAKLAGMFTEDATFTNPRGVRAVGREQIQALFRRGFETTLKGVKAEVTLDRVRLVAPDLAFVDAEQRLSGGTPPPGAPRPWVAHVVILARKEQAGRWMVLDFRPYFFLPAQPGSASAPAAGATR